jgi:hypothetical protein
VWLRSSERGKSSARGFPTAIVEVSPALTSAATLNRRKFRKTPRKDFPPLPHSLDVTTLRFLHERQITERPVIRRIGRKANQKPSESL